MKKTITTSEGHKFTVSSYRQGLIYLHTSSGAQGTHAIDLDVDEAAELISALSLAIKEAVQYD